MKTRECSYATRIITALPFTQRMDTLFLLLGTKVRHIALGVYQLNNISTINYFKVTAQENLITLGTLTSRRMEKLQFQTPETTESSSSIALEITSKGSPCSRQHHLSLEKDLTTHEELLLERIVSCFYYIVQFKREMIMNEFY
jgi:hypothetical protein